MKYTKPSNADLTVSRICLSCMGFAIRHTDSSYYKA